MNRIPFLLLSILFAAVATCPAQDDRPTISLNGEWDFDQTPTASAPASYTRRIPVPGLVHMATPKVEQYDLYFSPVRASGAEREPQRPTYEPRYNWYRRTVFVPKELEGRAAVLTLLKSQFVTQVFVNGMDVGYSERCTTPLDFTVTPALRYGADNEIVVRTGDHKWLPSSAPGGIDGEKSNYTPGIWDDVELSFTGKYRVHRVLVLPSYKNKTCTVKLLVHCMTPASTGYGVPLLDPVDVRVELKEKVSGQSSGVTEKTFHMRGGKISEFELTVPVADPHAWSPDDPFLYVADVTLTDSKKTSDRIATQWGLRDFERSGKYFMLNGQRILLRGSNITLHRFFNDPQCGDLPWDRAWVKKLLADIPKATNWNSMRICVGLLPRFWYDIADECGLMFQNEWLYWAGHGWDEQIRTEYTDWVWADGNHPSIAIWDAMNEYEDNYIGNVLIPELRKLDPTRVWDNGYMTKDDFLVNVQIPMAQKATPGARLVSPEMEPMNIVGEDEVDETHPYFHQLWRSDFKEWMAESKLEIGDLDHWGAYPQSMDYHAAAQIVNEYGWIWLWRNGLPSPHSTQFYDFYLGRIDDAQANRELQAYDLQWETELFRSHQSVAGVLAFTYLTNNFGATGDWFVDDIKDLKPGPTLKWFRHCFAPEAVFINLPDQRYNKNMKPYAAGSSVVFDLIGVNDRPEEAPGRVNIYLLDEHGVRTDALAKPMVIPSYLRLKYPVSIPLPQKSGGYLLVAEYIGASAGAQPVISRRYIKVGDAAAYSFYELQPPSL